MKSGQIRYRIRQFWAALQSTPLENGELNLARSILTDQQMALFARLHPSEQAHGLRVLRSLQAQEEDHPDLLAAALLHDVGKICHPLQPLERVIIVLARRYFPRKLKVWGRAKPESWKRPFVVACLHPQWGGDLVSEAGAGTLLVDLIREHQCDLSTKVPTSLKTRLLTALQRADNQN